MIMDQNLQPPAYTQNLLVQPGGVPVAQAQAQQQVYSLSGSSPILYAYQSGSIIYSNYKTSHSKFSGWTQILIGISLIAFNATLIALKPNGLGPVSHGFWGGLLFIATGSIGVVAADKRTKCLVISYMVLCIVSACIDIAVFSVAVLGIVLRLEDCYYPLYPYCGDNPDAVVAMHCVMVGLAVAEALMAIWGSVLGCRAACCCNDISTVTPMQFIPAEGTQVIIVGNPYSNSGFTLQASHGSMSAPPYEFNTELNVHTVSMSVEKKPLNN